MPSCPYFPCSWGYRTGVRISTRRRELRPLLLINNLHIPNNKAAKGQPDISPLCGDAWVYGKPFPRGERGGEGEERE